VRCGRRTATFCFVDRLRGDTRTRNTRATTAAAAMTIHVRGLARALSHRSRLCPPGFASCACTRPSMCVCVRARATQNRVPVCACVRVTVTVKGSGGGGAAAAASVAPTGAELRYHSPPPLPQPPKAGTWRGSIAACTSRDRSASTFFGAVIVRSEFVEGVARAASHLKFSAIFRTPVGHGRVTRPLAADVTSVPTTGAASVPR